MTRSDRQAFSLLEIILALALLAGAVAVLGQLSRGGLENAQLARDSTQAQLYCESKMAEIAAGLVAPTSQSSAPLEEGSQSAVQGWLCTVDVNPASQPNLLELRVTVSQDPTVYSRPVEYSLVRWMLDPNATTSSTANSPTDDGTTTSGTGAAP